VFSKTKEHFTGLIETKIELLKLDLEDKAIDLISTFLIMTVVGLFTALMILFFSIGLSLIINILLDSSYLGYLIISGVYLLVILSVILFVDFKALFEKVKANISINLASDD